MEEHLKLDMTASSWKVDASKVNNEYDKFEWSDKTCSDKQAHITANLTGKKYHCF